MGSPALFDALAGRALGEADGAIGTAVRGGDGFEVVVAAGDGLAPGDSLTGSRLALVERALTVDGLVSDLTIQDGERRLAFATAVDTDAGVVVFQEFVVDGDALIEASPESPFNDLEGALYVSDHQDSAALLLATSAELPIAGGTVRAGPSRWGPTSGCWW